MSHDNIQLAAALFAAIERKDMGAVAAMYADDLQVWHNFSDTVQDKAANLETVAALCGSAPEIHFDVTERVQLEDGRIMQRHVLRCRVGSEEVLMPACMLITMRGEQIAAIHEYLDTAQGNRLRAATGRAPVSG